MERKLFFILSFFSFSLFSCRSADDMTEAYNIKFSESLTSESTVVTEYKPGVYELKALIPDAEYTVDVTTTRQIQAKSGYQNYCWWLQSASGTLLAAAYFDEEGEREFWGGISAQSNYINILASLTSQLTTEYRTETGLTDSQKEARKRTAHTLRCHAYNEMGDEYWDTALLHVIPKPDEDEEEDGD